MSTVRTALVTDVYRSNSAHVVYAWDCCGLTSETDATGLTLSYGYDDLRRLISQTKAAVGSYSGYSAQSAIATTYAANADTNGQIWTTLVGSSGGLESKAYYDTAGRVIKTRDESGLDT